MKILIDMNLSPDWVKVLERAGWESAHWSTLGDMRATDEVVMTWAREHGYIVFTHDLDFGFTGSDASGKPTRDTGTHAGCISTGIGG